LILIEKYQVNN